MIALFCFVPLLSQCCIVFSASSIITYSIRTIYVDDDGGADYTSIQDAVDAANNKEKKRGNIEFNLRLGVEFLF